VNPALNLAKQQVKSTGRKVFGDSRAARRATARARSVMAARAIAESGVVDVDWYSIQAGRRFDGVKDAVAHYVSEGRLRGLSPNPLFEPLRRPEQDQRRLAGGYVPLAAILRRARHPRARIHPLFDTKTYLEAHPKAAKHRYGAWGHFLQHAKDDTPLPLPPMIDVTPTDGIVLRYGAWRDTVTRHLRGWAEQAAIADPPRLMPEHDAAAEKALREEVAGYPLPAPLEPGAPLISIVTAVRNRPNQVLEAVASVKAQTLDSWELIVVDDGSDDTTPDGVEAVARLDPRITVLRRGGEGVSAARNAGAAVARGRYLAWLDSDNTWLPDFLETMVKALSGRGLRAGYAACAMLWNDTVEYREFAAGPEHLAVGNVIDLNVLVVERDLVAEVGGFDPVLRRAVDYDLIFKVIKRTTIGYLPFLAAMYTNDKSDVHRISVKELRTWNYVVRERHVLDWDAAVAAVPERVAGRVSVVVSGTEEWQLMWATVLSLLRQTPADVDLEVVVVDGASSRTATLMMASLEALDPRVRVIRTVVSYSVSGGRNIGIARSTGETVVVLAAGVTVEAGWTGPLLAALAEPGVVAVSPVVTAWDRLIRWAGQVLPAWSTLPVPFLGGHPLQDARGLGERVDVPALAVGAIAVRAADAVAVRGFDPLYLDACDDADFSLRLQAATGGRCVVATGTTMLQIVNHEQRPVLPAVQSRQLFAKRWRRPQGRGDELWERAGFDVLDYRPKVSDGVQRHEGHFPYDSRGLEPVLRTRLPEGTRRWAIEVPDFPPTWPSLDDFGARVAAALERRGIPAVSRRALGRSRTPLYLDDVVVTIVGLRPVTPVSGRPGIIVTSPFARAPLAGLAELFDARVEDPLDDADALAARLVDTLAGIAAGARGLGGETGNGDDGDDHVRQREKPGEGQAAGSSGRALGSGQPSETGPVDDTADRAQDLGHPGGGVAGGDGERGLSEALGGIGGLQPR
jgi:glycosyltransferase involved in cell wall biosynthesis